MKIFTPQLGEVEVAIGSGSGYDWRRGQPRLPSWGFSLCVAKPPSPQVDVKPPRARATRRLLGVGEVEK